MTDEQPQQQPEPDEGPEVVEVFICITHVLRDSAGSFAVTAYDPLGRELASAPVVDGAEDWCDALRMFWAKTRIIAQINNTFGENQNPN